MFFFVVLLHEDMEAYQKVDFAKGRNSFMSTLVSMPHSIKKKKSPLAFC